MGYYINPPDKSKEDWLYEHGTVEGQLCSLLHSDFTPPYSYFAQKGCVPVVLIDNGPFTAAGIAYDEDEYKAFTGTDRDRRPRKIFAVPVEHVLEVCPEVKDKITN